MRKNQKKMAVLAALQKQDLEHIGPERIHGLGLSQAELAEWMTVNRKK